MLLISYRKLSLKLIHAYRSKCVQVVSRPNLDKLLRT